MIERPSWDEHFINIALEVALMGTCSRRQVGCVLVDSRNIIVSTGFNGVPPKWPHCDTPGSECPGAKCESGTNLDLCVANHSEVNALLHCADVTRARTCYCTVSPCVSCVKALLCTSITRIVFVEQYPHKESAELWTRYPLMINDEVRTRSWERFLIDSTADLGKFHATGRTRILAVTGKR